MLYDVYGDGPSRVVVVVDDAHDSLFPQCEVNGLDLLLFVLTRGGFSELVKLFE